VEAACLSGREGKESGQTLDDLRGGAQAALLDALNGHGGAANPRGELALGQIQRRASLLE
jgi:hypothetical protein